ncbi:MAG: hypothetical protein U0271_16735 [Polyangiaceae bacterium]
MKRRLGLLGVCAVLVGCSGATKASDPGTKASDASGAAVDVITQVKIVSQTALADGTPPPNVERKTDPGHPNEESLDDVDAGLPTTEAEPESTGPHQPQKVGHSTASTDVGRVDAENLNQAIAESRSQFNPCLDRDSSVLIDATISASGEVLEARSPQSIPDEPKLRDCVVSVFRRLKLAPLKASSPTRVSFELSLKRPATY